jgi:hypothetical protein
MSEWIPVIAALAGTLFGSLISYLATLVSIRREDKSENRAILISKIEEAHEVVRSIRQRYIESYGAYSTHLLIDKKLESNERKIIEIDRLEMLGNFYFPEMLPQINELNIRRRELGKVIGEVLIVKIKRSRSNKLIYDDLTNRYEKVDEACVDLFEKLSSIARKRLNITN